MLLWVSQPHLWKTHDDAYVCIVMLLCFLIKEEAIGTGAVNTTTYVSTIASIASQIPDSDKTGNPTVNVVRNQSTSWEHHVVANHFYVLRFRIVFLDVFFDDVAAVASEAEHGDGGTSNLLSSLLPLVWGCIIIRKRPLEFQSSRHQDSQESSAAC